MYCDNICRTRDVSFHSCGTQPQITIVNKGEQNTRKRTEYISYGSSRTVSKTMPANLTVSRDSRNGVCGLHNLGNTCFMNSGLQCLSNTKPLRRIFLEDTYVADLNPTNCIGTKCKLVKAFATLMKELWFGTEASVSPWYFKRELGDFVPQFYGFHQQDSHELICYTLDLIHEDLNRVREKPIPAEVDATGLSESEVAAKFWANHLSRNQSFIVDLMHGQYRSQVTCPDCEGVSLTFDPFVSVSVSLVPKTTKRIFEPIFVPADVHEPLVKLRVAVSNRSLAVDVKTAVADALGKELETLAVGKVFNYSVTDWLSDKADLSEYSQHYPLVVMEMPRAEGKVQLLLDVMKKPDHRYHQKAAYAFSRVLLIDENATMREVREHIGSYLKSSIPDGQATDLAQGLDFTLSLVNLQREKLQYGSSTNQYSSGSYSRLLCDFCKKRDCYNCEFPQEGTLKELAQVNQSGKVLKVEVVVPSAPLLAMRELVEMRIHESVSQVREEQERRQQALTLQECLSHSGHPEKLDADNEVYCSRCKKHVQAVKQMGLYKLPKILILHLKRFKERGYRKEKDDRLVTFPVEGLDMSPFVLGAQEEPPVYDLYAVSNHFGGLGGGHYTAYAKNSESGVWYGFNDSSASRVTGRVEDEVVTPSAYVLFYSRRDA